MQMRKDRPAVDGLSNLKDQEQLGVPLNPSRKRCELFAFATAAGITHAHQTKTQHAKHPWFRNLVTTRRGGAAGCGGTA